MMLPFPPWQPDRAQLNAGALTEILNVFPAAQSYEPVPALQAITPAVPEDTISAFTAKSLSNGAYSYFAASASKLYRWNQGSGAWADVSRPATTYFASTSERWQFVQYGNFVVAVNVNNDPQVFNLASGATFDNLGGSPPRARFVAVWGDFLVLASLSTDPSKLQWSGLDNISFWTVGQQNSDFQIYGDGGAITGITSSNNPLIFQEKAIRRGVFMPGSREIFRFDKLSEDRGLLYSYSLATRGSQTFFINEEGFHQFDHNGGYLGIGYEKVNKTFVADFDSNDAGGVFGVVDPIHPRVYWSYKSRATLERKIILYDWSLQKWSCLDVSAKWITPAVTMATSLDQLDALGFNIDTLPFSLDSPHLRGGFPLLAVFTDDNRMAFFNGESMEAILTTSDAGNTSGQMQQISAINPIIERTYEAEIFVSLGRKRNQMDEVDWTDERLPSPQTGIVRINSRGRYHRVKVRIAAGAVWNHAQGVDATAYATGSV
jgi:hypothetical protein